MIDRDEVKDIVVSVLAISLAFTIARLGGVFLMARGARPDPASVFLLFVISVVTVGVGFVLHEMAHKFSAIRYGAWAAYRSWPMGLQLALISSLFGFVFAAPGATYIFSPYMGRRQSGMVSLAGPLTNVALAALFLLSWPLLFLLLPEAIASLALAQGVYINLWLAFFNMLPIYPLDGSKVLACSMPVWAVTTGTLALLVFI